MQALLTLDQNIDRLWKQGPYDRAEPVFIAPYACREFFSIRAILAGYRTGRGYGYSGLGKTKMPSQRLFQHREKRYDHFWEGTAPMLFPRTKALTIVLRASRRSTKYSSICWKEGLRG